MAEEEQGSEASQEEVNRINISLQPRHKRDFEELADEHYDGVVSRMIRDSVYVNKQQLEGVDTIELKQMRSSIQALESEIQEIGKVLDSMNSQVHALHAGIDQSVSTNNAATNPDGNNGEHQTSHEIIGILDDYEHPIKIETLASESDIKIARLHETLSRLIDEGHVETRQNSDSRKYQLSNPQVNNE